MHAFTFAAASFAALASLAQAGPHAHSHLHSRGAIVKRDTTFNITVNNTCADTKTFALYQVDTAAWTITEASTPVEIASGGSSVIEADFTALGMRLSATADQGTDAQWDAQTLFEYGYSTYLDLTGTAYDLSIMEDDDVTGLAAYPANTECEAKVCTSSGCSLASAWTNADQTSDGSPADTVCYYGATDFTVVFCPS